MKILIIKNSCFGEIKFEDVTQEMKDRAFPILMLMALKRNGDLKTRGMATWSKQSLHVIKVNVVL